MSKSLPFKYERFSHQAMYTTFEVLMAGESTTYQKQAAREVFDGLTRLEKQISRFVENSDLTRLNLAPVNHPVLLSLDTFACLTQALSLCEMTQGTLNICMGRRTAKLFDREPDNKPVVEGTPEASPHMPRWNQLVLDPDTLTAMRTSDAVQVDLGAVGKGFALDTMAKTLTQWGLPRCLLHGGRSTVLVMDGPEPGLSWPVTLSYPNDPGKTMTSLALTQGAMSSSSQMEQSHIIDPKTGNAVSASKAAWSSAPNAIMADGLSTAFMIMPPKDIKALCEKHPKIGAMLWDASDAEKVETFGAWIGGKA
ncbi:MAG: FAD:protein FMN transferase [Phycisphaerae bacterium]|nr:FAD:protein FMN transferase [Phycisphaerae bacterium]